MAPSTGPGTAEGLSQPARGDGRDNRYGWSHFIIPEEVALWPEDHHHHSPRKYHSLLMWMKRPGLPADSFLAFRSIQPGCSQPTRPGGQHPSPRQGELGHRFVVPWCWRGAITVLFFRLSCYVFNETSQTEAVPLPWRRQAPQWEEWGGWTMWTFIHRTLMVGS